MKKIIISVTNDLSTDQRVDKVANSLINAGFLVFLVGACGTDQRILSKRNYKFLRFKMFFKKGGLFYLEFNIRLFFFLLLNKCDLLLSNDLDTLLANFFISKLKKIKLVYDSHELFTEVPELLDRPIVKLIWSWMESFFLKRIDFAYTVSQSIADFYKKKYGLNMIVVSNFPINKTIPTSNGMDFKKIIYQGSVNKDRGIKLMILSMKYVDAKLYIIGGGDMLYDMIKLVKKEKLTNKVIFTGKLDFKKLKNITHTADLGLSFESDTCLAYRYSLPNKIFDYIHADVPVLVSDLPEFRAVVEKYSIGSILRSREVKSVAGQINELIKDPKSKWFKNLLIAKKACCWENEEKKLLTLFNEKNVSC